MLFLAMYEALFRKSPAAVPFAFTLLFGAACTLMYLLELGSVDLAAKILWMKLRFIAFAATPVLWLVVTFHYIDRADWLTWGRIGAFSIEPAFSIVLTLSSGTNTLFRYNYHIDPTGGTPALLYTNGSLFPFHLLYLYAMFAASIILIAGAMRGRQPLFKKQSLLLIAGIGLPMLCDPLFQLGLIKGAINPSPIVFSITGICAAIALFHYKFLDVMPIATSLIMQTMDDLILVLDNKGRLIEFNPRARAAIGFDPLTAVGRPISNLPPAWASALDRFSGVTSARDRLELPMDGVSKAFDLTVSPLRDHLGMARGRLFLLHDVTERRLAEEELAVSRERLQLAFDSASDGLWDWEVSSGRTYWSPRYYMMLGYRPGEVDASFEAWKELVHSDDRARTFSDFDDLRKGPRGSNAVEFRMRTRDGGYRWILCRGRVAKRDAGGNALRVVGTHVDITERKEAEERLRESEEKFRSFIEQAAEAIMLIDESGMIIEYNPAAERMTGRGREEALGTPVWDLMRGLNAADMDASDLGAGLKERYMLALESGEGNMLKRQIEATLRRPDGTVRHFLQYIFPIRTKTGWRIGTISHDITAIKQAEAALQRSKEQLLQAQKMEAVGRLAGGIAHDFNNLLTVISGYCDLVNDGLPDESALREDLLEIMKAAERAATLTSQLLAFSRKQVLQPRIININELVRNMGKMLRRVIGEDIELATFLKPETGDIKADPGQIEQVIMNLAVNARDAMPEGGMLTIETTNRAVDEQYSREHPEVKPGEYVRLSVSDTGKGMEEETMSRIFEPFFTTKETGKGTGLGLPTAYGIVKQSEGHIFCYSELGKGTSFTIYFPRFASVNVAEPAKDRERSAAPGIETILLVEDEESVRGFTATVLRKNGYTVLEAKCGADALAEASARHCSAQLLITDVVMPQMSGRELARRLKEICKEVKILFISGYTEDAIVHHGILEKGIDFIQKPYSSQALLTRVREILDRK